MRASKSWLGTTTDFVHAVGLSGSGAQEEIAEYEGSTLTRRYVRLPGSVDEPFFMADLTLTGDQERWAHQNRFGSVVMVSNASGATQETHSYAPYGAAGDGGNAGFPFRFTGQRLDAETGLYFYKARYYGPDLGRFYQIDPVGYEDQMNLYAYVGNDQLGATDPTGEVAWLVAAAVGAGLDLAIQGTEICLVTRDSVDFKSVGVSAVAGAAGVGLASKAVQLGRAGALARAAGDFSAEAVTSAGATIAKGEELTLTGVLADVAVGTAAGEFGGDFAEDLVDDAASVAQEAGRRAQFPGFARDGSRASVANTNLENTTAAAPSTEAAASTAASGVGSAIYENTEQIVNEKIDDNR